VRSIRTRIGVDLVEGSRLEGRIAYVQVMSRNGSQSVRQVMRLVRVDGRWLLDGVGG
jgi:hypothetical protein